LVLFCQAGKALLMRRLSLQHRLKQLLGDLSRMAIGAQLSNDLSLPLDVLLTFDDVTLRHRKRGLTDRDFRSVHHG
jgi:hypothetical protein